MRSPAIPYLVSAAVVVFFGWYYWIHLSFPLTWGFANAILAFSATVVLAIAFLTGALSRARPLRRILRHRKTFGLVGYALAAFHVLASAYVVAERADPIAYSDAVSLVFAAMAFLIFTIMAITSTRAWVRSLGYANWRSLQRMGYGALLAVVIHIVLLDQGVFLSRDTGQWSLSFVMLTFLARALAIIVDVRRRRFRNRVRAERSRNGPSPVAADATVDAPARS